MKNNKILNKNFVIIALALLLSLTVAEAQTPDNKMLALHFNYKKSDAHPLTFLSMSELDGIAPRYNTTGMKVDYRLDILLQNNSVLHLRPIKIPYDSLMFKGLTKDVSGTKDDLNFTIYLPYIGEANKILISDVVTKKLVLEIPLRAQRTLTRPIYGIDFGSYPKILIAIAPLVLIVGILILLEVMKKKVSFNMPSHSKKEDLKNYIASNMKKGFKQEEIKSALYRNGYSKSEVEDAFRGMK